MIFDGLTDAEMETVEKIGVTTHYAKGSRVLDEGSAGTKFSMVLSGELEVRKRLNDGQSQAVTRLSPCAVVGELGFFGVDARSATVLAVSDCEMLEFDRESFDTFADSNPRVGLTIYRNMAEVLAERLAATDEQLREAIVWALARGTSPATRLLAGIRQNVNLQVGTGDRSTQA